MRDLTAGGIALFAWLICGCGSSSGGGGATTACTVGADTTRTCIETSSNAAVATGVAQAKTDCTNGGGVASDACSHVGADGGCKMTLTSGSITLSTTIWSYTGSPTSEMDSCTSGGNTWISP
jgi:hypothetical protein